MKKKDCYEQAAGYEQCETCKWENEPFEEEPNDGGAPCKRCIYWEDEE